MRTLATRCSAHPALYVAANEVQMTQSHILAGPKTSPISSPIRMPAADLRYLHEVTQVPANCPLTASKTHCVSNR